MMSTLFRLLVAGSTNTVRAVPRASVVTMSVAASSLTASAAARVGAPSVATVTKRNFATDAPPFTAVEALADVMGKIRHLEETLGQLSEGSPEAANLQHRLVKLKEEKFLLLEMVAALEQTAAAEKTIVAEEMKKATALEQKAAIRDRLDSEKKVLDDAELDSIVARLVARGLFKQPPPPSDLALWWDLGTKFHCKNIVEIAEDDRPHALIGLTGSGKTRAMYELLASRFGFYWSCSVSHNGGARAVQVAVGQLRVDECDEGVVCALVDQLLITYSLLFLAWREAYPDGTPLDWLVFQTTKKKLDVKHDVNAIVDAVEKEVNDISVQSVKSLLARVREKIETELVIVVDEAQVLANRAQNFKSSVNGSPRSPLSPWMRHVHQATEAWWVAGTSLSLRNVEEIAASTADKNKQNVVKASVFTQTTTLPYAEFEPFKSFVTSRVSCLADPSFDDALCELYDTFRGRARFVTHLVVDLANEAKRGGLTPEKVIAIGVANRDDLLDYDKATSLSRTFGNLIENAKSYTTPGVVEILQTVLICLLLGDRVRANEATTRHVELFSSAIAQVEIVNGTASLSCTEPLAEAALFLALCRIGPDAALNPLVSLTTRIRDVNSSSSGFMVESLVAPFIHHYIAANTERLFGIRTTAAKFSIVGVAAHPVTDIATGLYKGALIKAPTNAHPDWIHNFGGEFDGFGVLGEVKFRRSFSKADWNQAIRATSRRALFRVDTNPQKDVIRGFQAEHDAAQAAMDKRWPEGYGSYVFTMVEPKSKLKEVVDGRKVLVLSPKLCPDLFDYHPLLSKNKEVTSTMWERLLELMMPDHERVSVARAEVDDFAAATLLPPYRAKKMKAYRDKLLRDGVADDQLWGRIVQEFTSLRGKGRPDWLHD